jgi:hypothetical protein
MTWFQSKEDAQICFQKAKTGKSKETEILSHACIW